ncbi:MAG TPA: peptide MFS transporter [Gemmatimonadales bacterium]|nr:peptide MFS transporter [Gemmatimonadales bacterium]
MATAPVTAPPRATPPDAPVDTRFFGHPRGLATLFFTEFWERFSYYGMRAILILFMTAPLAIGGLGFETAKAGVVYGTYTSLVYLTALPGGWLADRFLGQRRATLYGGVVIMLGHICLAVPTIVSFYLGLLFVVMGTGLLKPNVSTMVGELYGPDDARRDAGFSIFYMGINLGAFLSPLICGWLAQSDQFRVILGSVGIRPESSWHWGFAAAAVGMLFGIVQYLAGWKHLGDAGMNPVASSDPADRGKNRGTLRNGIVGTLLLVLGIVVLGRMGILHVTPEGLGNAFGLALLLLTVIFFAGLLGSRQWTSGERKRLITIGVLFVASAIFWSVFEQAGSTLNLFAERSTDNRFLGMAFPASWFQSLNAIFIVLLAPAFAWLWVRLGKRDPSSPAKFVVGLFFVAAGFAILIVAAKLAAQGIKVSPLWLTATYLLHTIGELCLSPVGLSAMTKLAPARVAALMMGVWFLATSVGNYLGGRVAALYESFSLPSLFTAVTLFALGATLVLGLLVRPIERMLASDK